MRTKCCKCLCRTCLNTCCDRKNCTGKKGSCEKYSGFMQLSIFEQITKNRYQSAPRHPWEHYGISRERYRKLTEYIRSDKYSELVFRVAHETNKTIAKHIILSVIKNKSYEGLEMMWGHGDIERIPCGKTDFYGWRRLFYHLFDLEIRRLYGGI